MVKAIATDGLIEIIDIEHSIEDKVVWRYVGESRIHKCEVYYGSSYGGRTSWPYFNVNGRRKYLKDFMRL